MVEQAEEEDFGPSTWGQVTTPDALDVLACRVSILPLFYPFPVQYGKDRYCGFHWFSPKVWLSALLFCTFLLSVAIVGVEYYRVSVDQVIELMEYKIGIQIFNSNGAQF